MAKGNIDLFKRLMDAGADGVAGSQGCNGRHLLFWAAAHGNDEKTVHALTRTAQKPDGASFLWGLVSREKDGVETACGLGAGRGSNVHDAPACWCGCNCRGSKKSNPTAPGCSAGLQSIVCILLLRGADSEAKTRCGRSSLHSGCPGRPCAVWVEAFAGWSREGLAG